jgi:ArsR family transcriptional regulator
MKYSEFAPAFKAMSDEKRLKIIDMLSNGSLCACKILGQFDFTQPALSQHMKILVDAGLVSGVREGNWMHYSLVKEKYEEIINFVNQIYTEKKDNIYQEECGKCI